MKDVSVFFLFCPLRDQVDMKVTYCGDGPSFVASVDALIGSLFCSFYGAFHLLNSVLV